jgi:uncharacterized protein (TIGR02117 family)
MTSSTKHPLVRIAAKTLRFSALILSSFVLIVLTYLLFAYLLARIPVDGESAQGSDVTVYLLTNGVHTDIVVPAKSSLQDWTKEVKYADTRSNDTLNQYLAMGWGDKGFYLETPTWADLKASVAFKAATGLSTTAIHATFHNTLKLGDSCRKINITAAQYRKLIGYIKNSFQTDQNGHFMNIKTNANYGDTDAFYEAKGSYSMFHTCNTWVNNALKASGLKSCFWTPFDTGLFLLYEK